LKSKFVFNISQVHSSTEGARSIIKTRCQIISSIHIRYFNM